MKLDVPFVVKNNLGFCRIIQSCHLIKYTGLIILIQALLNIQINHQDPTLRNANLRLLLKRMEVLPFVPLLEM